MAHGLIGDIEDWNQRLADIAERYGVPGAVLGIMHGADTMTATHGVLNIETGVDVTADSLFQIGSITKVWTATMAMQFVDDGVVGLDAPILDVLPELNLGTLELTKQVTLRHLLSHTSGIDGDVFTDTGRGDDCLERYVELLTDVPQNHPVGATMSYSNAGFNLLGRVIEKLSGQTWDAALHARLVQPLGLSHTVTLPEDALRFRTAIGHVGGTDEPLRLAPSWGLPRSNGPAGSICSTVGDVLAFARLHWSSGSTPAGTQVLSPTSVDAMTERQVDVPDPCLVGKAWGLGWILDEWSGQPVLAHDGATIGQTAFLRILPERSFAVALFANGGRTRDLYFDLFREIFHDLIDVDMPAPLAPPAQMPENDLRKYVGTYERTGVRLEAFLRDGQLVLRAVSTGELSRLTGEPPTEHLLTPLSEDRFLTRTAGSQTWTPVRFYALADGSHYVHASVRATPKVA